jgi:hypothetical protein
MTPLEPGLCRRQRTHPVNESQRAPLLRTGQASGSRLQLCGSTFQAVCVLQGALMGVRGAAGLLGTAPGCRMMKAAWPSGLTWCRPNEGETYICAAQSLDQPDLSLEGEAASGSVGRCWGSPLSLAVERPPTRTGKLDQRCCARLAAFSQLLPAIQQPALKPRTRVVKSRRSRQLDTSKQQILRQNALQDRCQRPGRPAPRPCRR